jgi:hypothetical protein
MKTTIVRTLARCRQGVLGAGLLIAAVAAGTVGTAHAQYYQLKQTDAQRQVLKASSDDSVIIMRLTPFDVPAVPDSIELTYHEPMPDSIMPASAIVIGQIQLRMADFEDIVPYMEKYARKAGADWIVSFNEPRRYKTKDGDFYYKSSALLIKVLDPTFIDQQKLEYSYYEDQNVTNYAALQQYLGKQVQMGARVDAPQPVDDSNDGNH